LVGVVGYLAASQGHRLKTLARVFPEHMLVVRTELVYPLFLEQGLAGEIK
jgi:hypothetical protein